MHKPKACFCSKKTNGCTHNFSCSPIDEKHFVGGFVVNTTSDSFPLKCRGSDIGTSIGLGFRSRQIIVSKIAGNKNGLR